MAHTRTKTMSLQEWFDKMAAPEYKGPLYTAEEVCARFAWLIDRPVCCGERVDVRSMIGSAYHAECKTCGKWMHDVSVQFGNSWVQFPSDDVDQDTPRRWIYAYGPATSEKGPKQP